MIRYVKLKEPTEHTPEPWTPEDYGMTFNSELDLKRACACVNFCAGIPTKVLEQTPLLKLKAPWVYQKFATESKT